MKHLATAILLLGMAPNAFSGVYDITLARTAGAGNMADCQDVAEEMAGAFARQTSATILDYGCRPHEFGPEWIDAVLTYQASDRLPLISTYTPTIDAIDYYANRHDCVAQLAQQEEMFESATGLPVLVSYCMLSTYRWQTVVEGIGATALQADTASVGLYGDLLDPDQVAADYETAASAFGLTIFEMGVPFGTISRTLTMRFFGDDVYSIDDYDRMVYRTAEDCLAAADQVRSILDPADKPVVVFCDQQRNSPQSTLHATTFMKTLEGNKVFEARTLISSFTTLPECQAASDEIADRADGIFGAVCSGTRGAYKVHLFANPSSL